MRYLRISSSSAPSLSRTSDSLSRRGRLSEETELASSARREGEESEGEERAWRRRSEKEESGERNDANVFPHIVAKRKQFNRILAKRCTFCSSPFRLCHDAPKGHLQQPPQVGRHRPPVSLVRPAVRPCRAAASGGGGGCRSRGGSSRLVQQRQQGVLRDLLLLLLLLLLLYPGHWHRHGPLLLPLFRPLDLVSQQADLADDVLEAGSDNCGEHNAISYKK